MVKQFSENGVIIPENLMKKQADIESVATACLKMAQDKILWHNESDFHSIFICENSLGRFIKYGVSVQAGEIHSKVYSGNIPYLNYFLISYFLNPDIRKVLLVGLGSGILVKQLEKLFDKIAVIDIVDIEENILFIANNFFGFRESDKTNFYLQDAIVYLRNNRRKYDLIIVDVAGNEGIDERFFYDEFLKNIKKSLSRSGIFAFNSCANTDFSESDEEFFGFTIRKYKEYFKNFAVYDGRTSDELYYKLFFDIDSRILDVTNAIIFATDRNIDEDAMRNPSREKIQKISSICGDILRYTKDLHKIYRRS